MNAKKIMGAVLVALLAAALFVGAGAAASDIGQVNTYTKLGTITLPDTTTITFTPGQEFISDDGKLVVAVLEDGSGNAYFGVEGEYLNKKYSGNDITFTLVAPTAVVSAIYNGGVNFIGQTISTAIAQNADYKVISNTITISQDDVVFIDEDGVRYSSAAFTKPYSFITPGKWGVAANLTGKTGLVSDLAIQGQIYYFTVSKNAESLTAVKDTVNIGNTIIIKVAVPGAKDATVLYNPNVVKLIEGQEDDMEYPNYAAANAVKVRLGIDGTGTIAFTALDSGDAEFSLAAPLDAEVTVSIEKGALTAKADADYFFVGNPIYLSGTTTAGDDLHFYIEGQNFKFTNIDNAIVKAEDFEEKDGAWTVKLTYSQIEDADHKTLVAGTYPVIVSIADPADFPGSGFNTMKEFAMSAAYASATVTLTQPFITGVAAPEIVVQEDEYKITGTAYAAEEVRLYIFGTNYFTYDSDENIEDEEFEFVLTPGMTSNMAVGTYFYLIQHPMKDELFNVWTNESASLGDSTFGDFYYAATENAGTAEKNAGTNVLDNFVFNAFKRGTNYAAQALLEEIAGQNIDDIFVQGTFEVEAQKLVINPIPAEVAKGTALTISGYTNSGAGTEVIVNVLSGKFGATVKGDENAALFLTAKAVSKEDGTFEATIDTSKLELGNYVVTVEVDGIQYDSAAVSIVEKAPVTPVDPVDPVDPKPVDPVTPTEPTTPGFGALAALAGLGAVAVLLLRRE